MDGVGVPTSITGQLCAEQVFTTRVRGNFGAQCILGERQLIQRQLVQWQLVQRQLGKFQVVERQVGIWQLMNWLG
jgi:hypothetical protein